MNTKIYYIPKNPNIKKGTIYTLYINNNTNLDLSAIKDDNTITLNNIVNLPKENKIIIEQSTYDELVKINNLYQKIIERIINDTKKSNEENNKNITELNKLITQSQTILKKIISERNL